MMHQISFSGIDIQHNLLLSGDNNNPDLSINSSTYAIITAYPSVVKIRTVVGALWIFIAFNKHRYVNIVSTSFSLG